MSSRRAMGKPTNLFPTGTESYRLEHWLDLLDNEGSLFTFTQVDNQAHRRTWAMHTSSERSPEGNQGCPRGTAGPDSRCSTSSLLPRSSIAPLQLFSAHASGLTSKKRSARSLWNPNAAAPRAVHSRNKSRTPHNVRPVPKALCFSQPSLHIPHSSWRP